MMKSNPSRDKLQYLSAILFKSDCIKSDFIKFRFIRISLIKISKLDPSKLFSATPPKRLTSSSISSSNGSFSENAEGTISCRRP